MNHNKRRAPSFDTKSEAFKWLTTQWQLALSNPKKGISPHITSREFVNNIYNNNEFLHQYNKQNWYNNYLRHKASFLVENTKQGARKRSPPKKARSESHHSLFILC